MENADNYQLWGALRRFRDVSEDFLFLLSSLPSSKTPPGFPPLLLSSSLLLIAQRPPSWQRASVRLVESIDYHGAFLDGAVWLDACNCGVIKHWHRGFNGGLSDSLTFSRLGDERVVYFLPQRDKRGGLLCLLDIKDPSRESMKWSVYTLWFVGCRAVYTRCSDAAFWG